MLELPYQADLDHQLEAYPEPQVGIAEQNQAGLLWAQPEITAGNLFIMRDEDQPRQVELPTGLPNIHAPINGYNQTLHRPAGFVQLHLPPDIMRARDEDLFTFQLEARRISSALIGQLLDLENIIRSVDLIRGNRSEN